MNRIIKVGSKDRKYAALATGLKFNSNTIIAVYLDPYVI